MNNYANIPQEMRPYNQWIVWRYEGNDRIKTPYNAATGGLASVTDPNTWTDFNTAIAVSDNYSGPGFVYTQHDPYAIIDLDKTSDPEVLANQMRWYEQFPTYAERSPSGFGAHIICKAVVGGGRRDTRKAIEIYDRLRYVTFTGNVLRNVPIVDCQPQVDALIASLGGWQSGGPIAVHNQPVTQGDEAVIEQAKNSANGAKFWDLFTGNWNVWYPSQSEADFALINMIQYHTQNVEQITRIFFASALGQRTKATKRPKYINDMIQRSWDRQPPPVDRLAFDAMNDAIRNAGGWTTLATQTATLGGGLNAGSAAVAGYAPTGFVSEQPPAPIAHVNGHVNTLASKSEIYAYPPGLMGQIMHHILTNAPHPVPEIALAGAIGLMSGIAGRSFQTHSRLGLNLYTLVIAKPSRGKEAMKQGILEIVNKVERPGPGVIGVPAIKSFVGAQAYTTQRAIHEALTTSPCFVAIMREFGTIMEQFNAHNAPGYLSTLKGAWLDLFTAADRNNTVLPMKYSQKGMDLPELYRPSFSILAETTPAIYYENLTVSLIRQGWLNRFFTIEYEGERTPYNEYRAEPSLELVSNLTQYTVRCLDLNKNNVPLIMGIDNHADEALREYVHVCTKRINEGESNDDVHAELYGRCAVIAYRLAALRATGINWIAPTVSLEDWEWGKAHAEASVANIIAKFDSGAIGKQIAGDDNQNRDVTDMFIDWIKQSWSDVETFCAVSEGELMHQWRVVPHSYLANRATKIGSFRNDKRGVTRALYETLRNYEASGLITKQKAREFTASNGQRPFTGRGDVYYVTDPKEFERRARGRRRGF